MRGCNNIGLIERLAKDLVEQDLQERRSQLLHRFADKAIPEAMMRQLEAHVAGCRDCQDRVAEFCWLQSWARSRDWIAEAVCPSAEDLYAYRYDTVPLSTTQRQEIGHHINCCELCRQELDWLACLDTEALSSEDAFSDRSVSTLSRSRQSRLWLAVAVVLILALGIWVFKVTRTVPTGSNPYASLVAYPDINYAEFKAYRPADPLLAARYDEALRLCQRAQYTRARQVLESLAPSLPDHPGIPFLLGYSAYKIGDVWRAFDYWCRAEAIKPKSRQRCLFLLYLCLELGKPDRALTEVYEHARDPEFQNIGRRIKQIRSVGVHARVTKPLVLPLVAHSCVNGCNWRHLN